MVSSGVATASPRFAATERITVQPAHVQAACPLMVMASRAATVTSPPCPTPRAAVNLSAAGEHEPPHLHVKAAGMALTPGRSLYSPIIYAQGGRGDDHPAGIPAATSKIGEQTATRDRDRVCSGDCHRPPVPAFGIAIDLGAPVRINRPPPTITPPGQGPQ